MLGCLKEATLHSFKWYCYSLGVFILLSNKDIERASIVLASSTSLYSSSPLVFQKASDHISFVVSVSEQARF